jgi:hypothetical protein
MTEHAITYRGHEIRPKRDIGPNGFLFNGVSVHSGWVVVHNGCNPMPAAAWFTTIDEAIVAIDILIELDGELREVNGTIDTLSHGPDFNSDVFWDRLASVDKTEFKKRVLSTCTVQERHDSLPPAWKR